MTALIKDYHIDELLLNMGLLTLMAIITIGIIRQRNLFAVVILSGIYSFLMASTLIVLDAVDVAMTEASVGAGISTVLMLAALYLTKIEQASGSQWRFSLLPLALSVVTAGCLVFATWDLPEFGISKAPVHNDAVSGYYISQTMHDTTVPNVVTSTLASYRGYDTLGETTVVFCAGIGVMMLLKGRRRRPKNGATKDGLPKDGFHEA